MIVSSVQPYFFPYPGYFRRISESDVCVILDDVQFPRGPTWITRNRFKNDQGVLWLSVPVWKKGRGLQKISDVRICHEGRWHHKHLTGLITAYLHAPYLSEHRNFLENLHSDHHDTILNMNMQILQYVRGYLGIQTPLVLSSELGIQEKGSRLIVDLCRKLGGTHYLGQVSSEHYLDREIFEQSGIELSFMKRYSPLYPQLWGDFLPNLSILDLILTCGPKAREIMLGT
ncbi:MAG: WbqC family protein [Desulfomonilia bacterium]